MAANNEFHTVRGYQLIKKDPAVLTSAMEDYLEMCYRLCQNGGYARISKLSELLHVKPSSASKMIAKLSALGYLQYERYEVILLTELGRKYGEFLLNRHIAVERFLMMIGITDSLLEETELIEHSLSRNTVAHLTAFVDYVSDHPDWLRGFKNLPQKG